MVVVVLVVVVAFLAAVFFLMFLVVLVAVVLVLVVAVAAAAAQLSVFGFGGFRLNRPRLCSRSRCILSACWAFEVVGGGDGVGGGGSAGSVLKFGGQSSTRGL